MSSFESLSEKGVDAEAKALGVNVEWESANNDVSTQTSQIQNFITQHVDAIIVDPVQSDSLPGPLEKAEAVGIPVVATNVPLFQPGTKPTGMTAVTGNSPAVKSYVGPDDLQAGEHEMQALATALHGKGNIVELQGPLGQAGEINRTAGIAQVLAKYPGIHLLASQPGKWERPLAYTVMSSFWSAYGAKISGIVSENDDMAIASNRVLAQQGLTGKIPVVGIDGISDGMNAVTSGQEIESNLQDGMVEEGEAVWVANRIIHHQSYPKTAIYDMPSLVKSTVSHYYQQMYVNPAGFASKLPSIIQHDMESGNYSAQ